MLDLDQIKGVLEIVWPIYEAAEGWQEDHQHVCDVRCMAVNYIPDLTSRLAETVAELRAHRQALELASPIIEWLRPMHGRTAKAHESPCAACRFVAAVDRATGEVR